MKPVDTTLGGSDKRFPETTAGFSALLGAPSRAGLETLCRRYWKPVYSFVRVSWAKSNEDAKDLTQAFFARLLEGTALARFEPARGSFRAYLKTLLQRFVGHEEEALRALKRGGGLQVLSFDGTAPLLEELTSDPRAADPGRIFEQVWTIEIVNQAIGRVRGRHEGSGRPLPFRIYEEYALEAPGGRPTYGALAARHGITEREVETHLAAVRDEIRVEIRAELAQLTSTERELDREWHELFGA